MAAPLPLLLLLGLSSCLPFASARPPRHDLKPRPRRHRVPSSDGLGCPEQEGSAATPCLLLVGAPRCEGGCPSGFEFGGAYRLRPSHDAGAPAWQHAKGRWRITLGTGGWVIKDGHRQATQDCPRRVALGMPHDAACTTWRMEVRSGRAMASVLSYVAISQVPQALSVVGAPASAGVTGIFSFAGMSSVGEPYWQRSGGVSIQGGLRQGEHGGASWHISDRRGDVAHCMSSTPAAVTSPNSHQCVWAYSRSFCDRGDSCPSAPPQVIAWPSACGSQASSWCWWFWPALLSSLLGLAYLAHAHREGIFPFPDADISRLRQRLDDESGVLFGPLEHVLTIDYLLRDEDVGDVRARLDRYAMSGSFGETPGSLKHWFVGKGVAEGDAEKVVERMRRALTGESGETWGDIRHHLVSKARMSDEDAGEAIRRGRSGLSGEQLADIKHHLVTRFRLPERDAEAAIERIRTAMTGDNAEAISDLKTFLISKGLDAEQALEIMDRSRWVLVDDLTGVLKGKWRMHDLDAQGTVTGIRRAMSGLSGETLGDIKTALETRHGIPPQEAEDLIRKIRRVVSSASGELLGDIQGLLVGKFKMTELEANDFIHRIRRSCSGSSGEELSDIKGVIIGKIREHNLGSPEDQRVMKEVDDIFNSIRELVSGAHMGQPGDIKDILVKRYGMDYQLANEYRDDVRRRVLSDVKSDLVGKHNMSNEVADAFVKEVRERLTGAIGGEQEADLTGILVGKYQLQSEVVDGIVNRIKMVVQNAPWVQRPRLQRMRLTDSFGLERMQTRFYGTQDLRRQGSQASSGSQRSVAPSEAPATHAVPAVHVQTPTSQVSTAGER